MLNMQPEKNSQKRLNELMDEANQDNGENFKLGIILISVFIVVLLVIFGVYLFRSKAPVLENNQPVEEAKETVLDRFFNNDSNKAATVQDADNDGLSDQDETEVYKTDISKVDSDNDGLTDREEALVYKTNPNKADTDGDKVNDGQEIKDRHNPLDASLNAPWPPLPTDISSQK